MNSIFETWTLEALIEEERMLNLEIEAAQNRLGRIETEIFRRKNPWTEWPRPKKSENDPPEGIYYAQ